MKSTVLPRSTRRASRVVTFLLCVFTLISNLLGPVTLKAADYNLPNNVRAEFAGNNTDYVRIMYFLDQFRPGEAISETNKEELRNFLAMKIKEPNYGGFAEEYIDRFRLVYPDGKHDRAYCIEFGYLFNGNDNRTIMRFEDYMTKHNLTSEKREELELIGYWSYEYHRNDADALHWADVASNMIWEALNPGLIVWSDMPSYADKRSFVEQNVRKGMHAFRPQFEALPDQLIAGETVRLKNINPNARLDAFYVKSSSDGLVAKIEGNELVLLPEQNAVGAAGLTLAFGNKDYTGISLVSDGLSPDGPPMSSQNRQAVLSTKFQNPLQTELSFTILPAQLFNAEIKKTSVYPTLSKSLAGASYDLIYAAPPNGVPSDYSVNYLNQEYPVGSTILSNLKTDEEGLIRLQDLPLGTYDLIETAAPDGFLANSTAIRIVAKYDGTKNRYTEDVQQIIQNLMQPLEEVNAAIRSLNEKIRINQGRRSLLTELEIAPVEPSELITYERPALGYLEIMKHKTEQGDNFDSGLEVAEENIEFIVTDESGNEVDRMETNVDGWACSKLLPIGQYTLTQITEVEGLKKMEPFTLAIDVDGERSFAIIENAPIYARLQFFKTDARTKERIPASGIGFQIFSEESGGKPISMQTFYPTVETINTFYTDANGSVILPEQLRFGDYYLAEIKGPEGYFFDPDLPRTKISVQGEYTVIEQQIETKEVFNEPLMGIIEIQKTGSIFRGWQEKTSEFENNKTYTYNAPKYEEGALENVIFELIAAEDIYSHSSKLNEENKWEPVLLYKSGEVVDTIETNAEGFASSVELALGKYMIKETKAPVGYALAAAQEIELTADNPTVRVTTKSVSLHNEPQQYKLSFEKIFETSKWHEHHLQAPNKTIFGLFTQNPIQVGEYELPAETAVGFSGLDENLNASFLTAFPGEYYVKELVTHEAYELSDKTLSVIIAPAENQEKNTIEIALCPVKNDLKKLNLELYKISSKDEKPLENAIYRLVAVANGKDREIGRYATNKEGLIQVEGLEFGEYYLEEEVAPEGYVRLAEPVQFSINENTVLDFSRGFRLEIANNPTITRIRKVDVTTKEELPGAALSVIDITTGEVIDRWISTKQPHIIEGLLYGRAYRLVEELAPLGYEVTNTVHFSLSEDGVLNEVVIENELNAVEVLKICADSKKPLSGAKFAIVDTAQDLIAFAATDKNGKLIFRGLKPGQYILKETKAPTGYRLNESDYILTIDQSGRPDRRVITVENKQETPVDTPTEQKNRRSGTTNFPVTGDSIPVSVPLGILTSGLAFLLIGLWKKMRKHG